MYFLEAEAGIAVVLHEVACTAFDAKILREEESKE